MINLLPPEEKEELLLERKKRIIIILWILFLFLFVCLILLSFLAKIYLQIQVISQKELLGETEKSSLQSEMQDLKGKINSINQNLTKLESFYKKKSDFSEILDKVSKTLAEQIYLTNFSAILSFAGKESVIKVSLSGFAPSRESLFGFKQNLEKEGGFRNIYFPPINWVKPTDIDFFVTLEYNLGR